jgi:hypothetical protein
VHLDGWSLPAEAEPGDLYCPILRADSIMLPA